MPGKYKIDKLYYKCRVCGKEYYLTYKSRNKRLNRAKRENREVDFSLCTTCGKKINKNITMMKRHNTIHALRVPEFMEKRNQTMIERVGTKDAMKVPEFKAKHRQTCLKNHGDEIASRTEKVKEIQRQTNLKKYNVPYTGMVKEFQEKRINTLLEKYNTTDVFKIHNPNGSKLEQDFLNKIKIYFFENQLPYKIKQEFRTFDKTYDFVIYNPDGSINCLVECDGYYFHGYKYENGYTFFDKTKVTSDKKIRRDNDRLFKADYLKYKIFIIRQNTDNTVNLEDFNLLLQNLSLNYKEWIDREIQRVNVFYNTVLNSIQIYNNFINSMRIKYYGFIPYDIKNELVKQEDGYLYKDHIGPTPYDIKSGDEYLL